MFKKFKLSLGSLVTSSSTFQVQPQSFHIWNRSILFASIRAILFVWISFFFVEVSPGAQLVCQMTTRPDMYPLGLWVSPFCRFSSPFLVDFWPVSPFSFFSSRSFAASPHTPFQGPLARRRNCRSKSPRFVLSSRGSSIGWRNYSVYACGARVQTGKALNKKDYSAK